MKNRVLKTGGVLAVALAASAACGVDFVLGGKTRQVAGVDDPRDDLRPGLVVSCRVRFDADPAEKGQMDILSRGNANSVGSYILRVDGKKEGVKFSFFVNVNGTPEPRISLPFGPKVGVWHDIAAGWDGTNVWICVDGKTARRLRKGEAKVYPLAASIRYGAMDGTIRDAKVTAPAIPMSRDCSLRPGARLACDVTFARQPVGETTILSKAGEYWLRYDRPKGGGEGGAFNFFVFVGGCWEPRASVSTTIETGRAYRISAGWSGLESTLAVEGVGESNSVKRRGKCPSSESPLAFGPASVLKVSNFCIRNERKAILAFGMFRTRELMPREGETATLVGSLDNIGLALGPCSVVAKARGGAKVEPEKIDVADLGEGQSAPLEWRVSNDSEGFAFIDFAVCREGKTIHRGLKRVVFMPKVDPDYSAKKWSPPHKTTRTYHVDAEGGDDARDGLTPATAWKTFRNVAPLTLGPGERLLLKRGCTYREELVVKACGSAENWAVIGAYGEGMRPEIRRNRSLDQRCAFVEDAAYLAVRDLIVCNAGAGLHVRCMSPESGHVLVERILAHHIEGTYRFNSHGIPEWWNMDPPSNGGRSWGIAVNGARPNHVVMRDCESYQCSSGYSVTGHDTFVNRMFSHDNYAHNTSPHPYNCASRSWITDCVFDASGWHAAAGTMGIMLAGNDGWIMRGCHFLNQPDSGSPDQGGIDFEAQGENCLVDRCTFRNNAGAAIEVLGLRTPQTRNLEIRGCRFDRNNWAVKNGPAEIQIWGSPTTPADIVCSNGSIHDNGCVLVPGIPFYVNETRTTNDWHLANNREFDYVEDLDAAFPWPNPPAVSVCREIFTDSRDVALWARVDDPKAAVSWEQVEGAKGVTFANPKAARTHATFPGEGDWRLNVAADNGTLWRAARTAVHVLPKGARTSKAWTFSRNLDAEGWSIENAGTGYQFLPGKIAFWNSESFPVRLVCGDAFVIAVKESATAAIVTECDRDVGVDFSIRRANTLRVKMQNRTNSKAMRLWWQTDGQPTWDKARSVVFAVRERDGDDALYSVALPRVGGIKQLKISFSAEETPITGTVMIDYIWLGNVP